MSLGLEFSSEIRAGDIVSVVSFIGVGIAAFMNIRTRLSIQDLRLEYIEAAIEDNKVTLKTTQTTEHRLNQCELRITELQHGDGYIRKAPK